MSVTGAGRAQLIEAGAKTKLDTILAGLDVLVAAKGRLRFTTHTRVFCWKWPWFVSVNSTICSPSRRSRNGCNRAAARASPCPKRAVRWHADPRRISWGRKKKKRPRETDRTVEVGRLTLTEETLAEFWPKLLTEVGFVIAAELRKGISHAIIGPNSLVIRYPEGYNAVGKVALDTARLGKIEEALLKLTGETWSIKLEYVKVAETTSASSTAPPVAQNRQLRPELAQFPLVKRAKEALNAEIIRAG